MVQIPQHLQAEFDKLSEEQKAKFHQLMMWSNPSGLQGVYLPMQDSAIERCLKMVQQMGAEPDTPIEPDRTVNHDWDFDPKQNKGK